MIFKLRAETESIGMFEKQCRAWTKKVLIVAAFTLVTSCAANTPVLPVSFGRSPPYFSALLPSQDRYSFP